MEDFNWINARSECSLAKVFELLKAEVGEDVNSRNALLPEGTANKFSTVTVGNVLTVMLVGLGAQPLSVKFTKRDHSIECRDADDKLIFDATPGLDHNGNCMIRIGNSYYELWQVRRLALEQLFFEI